MNASNPFNTALFYKNTHLSDCKLAIVDEAADVDITQEVLSDSIVLPVHRVLLAASSTVFDNVFLVDSPQPIHLLKVCQPRLVLHASGYLSHWCHLASVSAAVIHAPGAVLPREFGVLLTACIS